MSRDSGGTYTLPAGNPVAEDTLIDAAWANATMSDLGNEMSNTLHKDGRVAMTGPLVLSTRGSPLATDAASWENVQSRIDTQVAANFPNLGTRQAFRHQTKSANYSVVVTDYMSVINCSTSLTLALPAAATAGAGFVLFVQAASGAAVTLDPDSSETINGAATYILGSKSRGLLFCDGTGWTVWHTQDYANTNLTKPTLTSAKETTPVTANATGSVAIDFDNGNVFQYTLTGNTTFSFSNVPATGAFCATLVLYQDGTGGRTVTWPGAVLWPSGVAPTITTAASAVDIISLMTRDGGTTWYGFIGGQDFS